MTIASSIYQEMKWPCIVGITSAAYCAITNQNIKTSEKTIKYTTMVCMVAPTIPGLHNSTSKFINREEGMFSQLSPWGKNVSYIVIMSIQIGIFAKTKEKINGWLSYKIAEFVTDTLKFTMGNLSFTLGLNYQGLQWQSSEEGSLEAVGSAALESGQIDISE